VTPELRRSQRERLTAVLHAEIEARCTAEPQQAALAVRDVFLELLHQRDARCVALYVSEPGEVDTMPLRLALAARGLRVLLPVAAAGIGHWRVDEQAPSGATVPLRVQPPRPIGLVPFADVDILVVPALAVDTQGRWLGRDRRHYNHAVRQSRYRPLVLAGVHDDEVLDAAVEPLPSEAGDITVDAAITPTRVFSLR
jgi:5-formyltetrahydrofolate cyclo-ligase